MTQEKFDSLLGRIVQRIMISSEERIAKPKPQICLRLLDALGIVPARPLAIDDNPVNLAGAAMAGIPGVLFENAEQFREYIEESFPCAAP